MPSEPCHVPARQSPHLEHRVGLPRRLAAAAGEAGHSFSERRDVVGAVGAAEETLTDVLGKRDCVPLVAAELWLFVRADLALQRGMRRGLSTLLRSAAVGCS